MPANERGRRRENKEKVLSRGPTSFPSCALLQASTSPCRFPPTTTTKKKKKEKKQSINKRTVAQIGEGMSRFSMGFSGEGTRGRNLLLLSVVQMGLMSPELEALLVIGVLISCENWFPSFGVGGCEDWGYIHAWKSKIRAKWTKTNLLYQKKILQKPKTRLFSKRKKRK